MNPYYIAVGIGIVIGACGAYMMRNRTPEAKEPSKYVTTNPNIIKPGKLEMLINPPIKNSALEVV